MTTHYFREPKERTRYLDRCRKQRDSLEALANAPEYSTITGLLSPEMGVLLWRMDALEKRIEKALQSNSVRL